MSFGIFAFSEAAFAALPAPANVEVALTGVTASGAVGSVTETSTKMF